MRPSLLDPLFAPAASLPGIGPKNAKLFDRLLDKSARARAWSTCCSICRRRPSTGARGRRSATPCPTRSSTIEATGRPSIASRRSPRSQAPFKVLVEDDTGDVELVFFLANHEWVRSTPAGRRDALDLRQARAVGRPAADRPSRPGDGRRRVRPPAGGRAGLRPDRGPLSAHRRPRRRGALKRAAAAAGMDRRRHARAGSTLPGFAEALARDAPPERRRATSTRPARRRPASPMTNCSPTSSRCCSCGRACAPSPAARIRAEGALGRAHRGRAAVRADRRAEAGDRRDPRRSQGREADDPAPAGRRRLGQDDRRAARDGRRGRSGTAGGDDGADRNARPPALSSAWRRSPRRPACGSR